MEGLIGQAEKPSNTEVLGLLMDEEKLPFITNLTGRNIKGLCKLLYFSNRLKNPSKNPLQVHEETLNFYMALKCSENQGKKGNRSDQIVDALKHIIDADNKDDLSSIAESLKR